MIWVLIKSSSNKLIASDISPNANNNKHAMQSRPANTWTISDLNIFNKYNQRTPFWCLPHPSILLHISVFTCSQFKIHWCTLLVNPVSFVSCKHLSWKFNPNLDMLPHSRRTDSYKFCMESTLAAWGILLTPEQTPVSPDPCLIIWFMGFRKYMRVNASHIAIFN